MENELEKYFDRLWPICRSITGNGLRESFRILQEIIPLELEEVPTGTDVFDWTIPKEWNIEEAYIITPDGKRVADFARNNLHVVNYSAPVDREVGYEELALHMHTLPRMPLAVPYVTSYYKENWGFCMAHKEWNSLPRQGNYRVVIKSSLAPGSLTYGHLVLPGRTTEEVFFSSYLCHPSMANNELSGPLALAMLYKKIAAMENRRYTYRFILAPETIGVLAYLSMYGEDMKKKTVAGYVMTCCGDDGVFHYKKSKQENSAADRVAEHALKYSNQDYTIERFQVGGSDERQYCSPGFNLPAGSLMRTPYQQYPEYHTSLDDKEFISFEALAGSVDMYLRMVEILELNDHYTCRIQRGEPQLGKRGLYPDSVNPDYQREELHNLLHFLSFADGSRDLIDIAEWRNCSALDFRQIIQNCRNKNLI